MCVGGSGSSSPANLRKLAGSVAQRQVQTQSLQSVPYDGGTKYRNEVRPDKMNRVALPNETAARIKARPARKGQAQEVNYRSQRKRKGTGLRIGGSGVNVPGGGSGVNM